MKLEPAKSALAKAEMELKLITGGMQKEMVEHLLGGGIQTRYHVLGWVAILQLGR